MTEHIFEAIEAEAQRIGHGITSRFHHPHPSATITTSSTKEDPVSVFTDLKADVHQLAGKLDDFDDDAISKLEAVQANPETATVFAALTDVSHLTLPTGILSSAVSVLEAIGKLIQPTAASEPSQEPPVAEAAEPQVQVPGPQVAGVA
jgi:hypothetical protein